MVETKLHFLLMGKTGEGKSATGNTILKRRLFKTSSKVTSETKEVSNSFALFGSYVLQVVDGPGLEDTAMNQAEDKVTAAKSMDTALAMCYGGVDAFLLCIKFGHRFTAEDKNALVALKRLFGNEFINHVIVVVTCGDIFPGAMEEQDRTRGFSFHDWCRDQTGEFRKLYNDCEERFVLFNNREKDEEANRAQIQEVVTLAEGLQKQRNRYTSNCYEDAKHEHEKLILELRAPELKEEIQMQISLLTADINDLIERPSYDGKEKIRVRVQELLREIDKHDKGYGVLKGLRDMVRQVEGSLNDVDKLLSLGKELEEIRQAKKKWGMIRRVCTFVGAGITLVAPPLGAAAAVVATGAAYVATSLRSMSLSSAENKIEQEQKEIKSKRK